jgi:hypothetical protein
VYAVLRVAGILKINNKYFLGAKGSRLGVGVAPLVQI